MILMKAVLTIIAAQTVNQFWADSLEMTREMEEIKEKITYVQTVCGVVELQLPNQAPEYDLQCDIVDFQGDN